MIPRIEKYLTATLKLQTAMHIGAGKVHLPTDAPLRRASDGTIFIPGRAIGGVLRGTATLLAPKLKGAEPCRVLTQEQKLFDAPCRCPVCTLFGDIAPGTDDKIARARLPQPPPQSEEDAEKDKTAASRLWIEDACLDVQTEHPETLIRDGVGIGRATGAAYKHARFDHEILPAGTKFSLCIKWVEEYFKPETEDAEKRRKHRENFDEERKLRERILAAALAEWQNGRGYIGANKARGLGRFALENVELRTLDLKENAAGHLIEYLLEPRPELAENKAWLPAKTGWIEGLLPENEQGDVRKNLQSAPLHCAKNFVTLKGEIHFDSAFLSNDPTVAAWRHRRHEARKSLVLLRTLSNHLRRPGKKRCGMAKDSRRRRDCVS